MPELALSHNLAGAGFANTLAISLNAFPEVTTPVVQADIFWRFLDEPDSPFLYLGIGTLGETFSAPLETKGRDIVFAFAPITLEGERLVNDYAQMKQVIFTPDPTAETGAPIEASEDMTAGMFVNIYDQLGDPRIRKANATNNTKPCHGFIAEDVLTGATTSVYFGGTRNVFLTGLTNGATYFLSTTGGTITTTAPTASGNIQQQLGEAVSDVVFLFEPQPTIEKR